MQKQLVTYIAAGGFFLAPLDKVHEDERRHGTITAAALANRVGPFYSTQNEAENALAEALTTVRRKIDEMMRVDTEFITAENVADFTALDIAFAEAGIERWRVERGERDPQGTRGPYDAYMTPVEGGWQVAAGGVILAPCVPDEEDARAVMSEHAPGRNAWKVATDGSAVRLG